ncbi:MAG TPA: hypothetical protein VM492_06050 [Sumerlaeia bacterium]|nr:hypothetical protein [Sumerlaeia bacterium]
MAARKTGKRESAGQSQSLQSAVALEARRLRTMLREVSQRFAGDLESEIVEALEMVDEIADGPQKKVELQTILDDMRALEVKPRKGRIRDLKRIDKLVREMTRRLEDLL